MNGPGGNELLERRPPDHFPLRLEIGNVSPGYPVPDVIEFAIPTYEMDQMVTLTMRRVEWERLGKPHAIRLERAQ